MLSVKHLIAFLQASHSRHALERPSLRPSWAYAAALTSCRLSSMLYNTKGAKPEKGGRAKHDDT